MPVTIQCPTCNARLVIQDPSILGKKVKCPKCQNPFRAKAPTTNPLIAPVQAELVSSEVVKPQTAKPQTAKPQAAKPQVAKPTPPATQSSPSNWDARVVDDASAAHASFDFSDHEDPAAMAPSLAPAPPDGVASAWAAPVREVRTVKKITNEERLAQERKRDRVFAIGGMIVGGGLLVGLLIAGVWYTFKSVTAEKEMAAAREFGKLETSQVLADALRALAPSAGTQTSDYAELEKVYPKIWQTTEKQESLLAENKPIRDIARVEGFQATALRLWGQSPVIDWPEKDSANHAQRELRIRLVAAQLRSAIYTGSPQVPSKESWEAWLYAEQAMFEDEALTKKAIKDSETDALKSVVQTLETWAPSLGLEMPKRRQASVAKAGDGSDSSGEQAESGKANLPTIFGFDAKTRALLVDYLREQGHSQAKARLTMAMVATALGKTADELSIDRTETYPDELNAIGEAIETRAIPRDLLLGPKIPIIFSKLISDYENEKLKPEEEALAKYVIIAFLATELR